jgi:protein involved in polysaccharide export with SLBB domain
VINALYAAGGPNQVGSYRAVRLLRAGRIIKEIDLYDFFAGGKLTTISLQDQDVLQVPAFEAQVELKGAFKTPGYYELKKDETLADVLEYSGGFLSDGYKERVFVSRIMDYKRQSVTLATNEGAMHLLKDGDVIEANLVQDVVENAVKLEGGVYIPGTYSLTSVKTVEDAIEAAGGLTREALKSQATLFRSVDGVESRVLSIDLNDERQLNYPLKDGDRLFVPKQSNLFDSPVVRVQGEVNSPGVFEYKEGMSLSDALILAKGFTANANKSEVILYQNFLFDGETITQTETVPVGDNLVAKDQVLLNENTVVIVRRDPNFRKVEQVSLSGLVLNEGAYAVKGNNYRLYDLLKDSGGFLKDAYLKGISIERQNNSGNNQTDDVVLQSIEEGIENSADQEMDREELVKEAQAVVKGYKTNSIFIGIDGERLMRSGGSDLSQNVVLQDGDIINVPKLDNTLTVLGEVQKESKMAFNDNLTINRAIFLSGGFNQKARRSRVYVVYKNGSVKSRRRLLGLFKVDPKLEPGSTVLVPEKLVRENRTGVAEIVGLTSSLATVALLIRQLGL